MLYNIKKLRGGYNITPPLNFWELKIVSNYNIKFVTAVNYLINVRNLMNY